MAKPICVIYLPFDFQMGFRSNPANSLMNILNGFETTEYQTSDYFKDYYWFCFPKPYIKVPEFQVFHAKDITEIDFEYLRNMVMKRMEELAKMAGSQQ